MAQEDNPRRAGLVFPILLVSLGMLFLVHNWRPAFDPWPILETYWPVILIFVGLGKIWDNVQRSRNPGQPARFSVGAGIGAVAFVVLLVVLLWQGRNFSRRHELLPDFRHSNQTVDLQGAQSVRARLEMGAGQLTISGDAAHLVDADFTYSSSFDAPRVDYNVAGGAGQLTISQDSRTVHFGRSRNEWNLRFGREVPIDLKIDMGAGQGNLHFRDVPLTRLELNLGAGQVDVDLTGDRKKDLTADIEGGVGQAKIRLPRNVGVIARASGGIGAINAHGLKRDGNSYTNDAYGKSPATIRLKVEGGIGQIDLTEE